MASCVALWFCERKPAGLSGRVGCSFAGFRSNNLLTRRFRHMPSLLRTRFRGNSSGSHTPSKNYAGLIRLCLARGQYHSRGAEPMYGAVGRAFPVSARFVCMLVCRHVRPRALHDGKARFVAFSGLLRSCKGNSFFDRSICPG